MKTLPARLGQQSHQLSVRAARVPPLHVLLLLTEATIRSIQPAVGAAAVSL